MNYIDKIAKNIDSNLPDPIDIHVGKRLRFRRNILGLSQEQLAKNVGISFQQIQKYEHGTNRISASRLYDISVMLDVPVAFFFDDINEESENISNLSLTNNIENQCSLDPMKKNETLELVNFYWKISNKTSRTKVLELIKSLSNTTG